MISVLFSLFVFFCGAGGALFCIVCYCAIVSIGSVNLRISPTSLVLRRDCGWIVGLRELLYELPLRLVLSANLLTS